MWATFPDPDGTFLQSVAHVPSTEAFFLTGRADIQSTYIQKNSDVIFGRDKKD